MIALEEIFDHGALVRAFRHTNVDLRRMIHRLSLLIKPLANRRWSYQMRARKLVGSTAIVTVLAAGSIVALGTPANALSSASFGSQYGNVARARLYEHANLAGATLTMYGSGNCSASTMDVDLTMGTMKNGWNDAVSSIRDYAACDTMLYEDGGALGTRTGWNNYGTGGTSVGSAVGNWWNDRTSSVRLS